MNNLFTYRPGLLAKSVFALSLVTLLPLSLVSYRLIDVNREALTDQVLRSHALATQTSATSLALQVNARLSQAQWAANTPSVFQDAQSREGRLFLSLLLQGGGSELIAVSCFNAENKLIVRLQRPGFDDVAESLLAQPVTNGLQLLQKQDAWLLVSAPFPEGGDLRLLVDATGLQEQLNPIELGDEALMVLANDLGETVFSSKAGITLPPSMKARAGSQHVSGAGRFLSESGATILGAHAPVSQMPWQVVSWQPVQVAEAISQNMRRRALEAVGLALFLSSLLAAFVYSGVIKPIRGLLKKSERGLRGGDEISQLQEAFKALERHVEDAEELEQVFLGRYKVIEKVGQGGMGMVFHGWDPKLKRPVALKTLNMDFTRSTEERINLIAELVKEATAAANINHSNVVSVYDATDVDDMAYVAMEFVDGPSLAGYLKAWGALLPTEAAALFLQITQGIEAAHEKGIIHRDIKPANILLGRDSSVKVADFGISQFMNAVSGDDKVYGTPGFLPPETLYGKPFNQQGDLFALGATMFHVLTGKPAFPGSDVSQIIQNTISHQPHIPPELAAHIPKPLADIVMKLLQKNPEARYKDAHAVIAELRAIGPQTWHYQELIKLDGPLPKEDTSDDLLEAVYLNTITTSPREETF